jgi:hypothetical protein
VPVAEEAVVLAAPEVEVVVPVEPAVLVAQAVVVVEEVEEVEEVAVPMAQVEVQKR